jgi:hypothetical protein
MELTDTVAVPPEDDVVDGWEEPAAGWLVEDEAAGGEPSASAGASGRQARTAAAAQETSERWRCNLLAL